MMNKRIIAILCALLALAALTACSGSANTSMTESQLADEVMAMPAEAPMASMEYVKGEAEYYDSGAGVSAGSIAQSDGAVGAGELTVDAMTEKIIYNANSTIETMEFEKSIETIDELMTRFGAFIESSSVSGVDYYSKKYGGGGRTANYTIRVPIENYSGMTDALSAVGNVVSFSTYSENITTQYYDSQSRLNAYRTQEERLLTMLAKVDTIEAMIAVESELSSVRYQIESLQTQLNSWDHRVRYSTVSIYLYEVAELTVETPVVRTYWEQVGDGFSNSLKSIAKFFKELFKWLVSALPVIVILVVIAGVVLLIVRRVMKKSRRGITPGADNGDENKTGKV